MGQTLRQRKQKQRHQNILGLSLLTACRGRAIHKSNPKQEKSTVVRRKRRRRQTHFHSSISHGNSEWVCFYLTLSLFDVQSEEVEEEGTPYTSSS